ncbi:MAG: competence/damage-inducible protein A [Campylobacterales bacterium]|nr:competence/damage-inducible protein A [Campylobacterales bacterium]
MNFYAVIIGTEILNGKRSDKHFEFIKNELAKYGHELYASLVIKDEKHLIKKTFEMIKEDSKAVLFSFGGIGSTPDDLTREISADVFTNDTVRPHEKFLSDIIERFQEKAYPHRIHMADLPKNSDLLFNPVNNMSGYSLQNRYFFVPGFPEMAHPMISDVIKKHYSISEKKFIKSFIAQTSEETLITLMQQLPKEIELSCLPMFINKQAQVELSLGSTDYTLLEQEFQKFLQDLEKRKVVYNLM